MVARRQFFRALAGAIVLSLRLPTKTYRESYHAVLGPAVLSFNINALDPSTVRDVVVNTIIPELRQCLKS